MSTDSTDSLDLDFLGEDLVLEQQQQDLVEDADPRGLSFGFICAGQCGNNIGSLLWEQGYRRVIQFNTTAKDLQVNKVPARWHVLAENYDGAGKDRGVGKTAALSVSTQIHELVQTRFRGVDFIYVVTSTGGGSGSGSASVFAGLAKSYLMQSRGYSAEEASARVGVIAVLPKPQEGSASQRNSTEFLHEFVDGNGKSKGHSPLFFIDNARAEAVLPKSISITAVNSTINRVVIGLFDTLNTVSARHSEFATFDPKDYTSILGSGIVCIGISELPGIESDVDISRKIRSNLTNTLLVDKLDLSTATHAGLLLIAGDKIMPTITNKSVTMAQESLVTLLNGSNTDKEVFIHTGIYRQNKEKVTIITLIGGLSFPTSRL